MFRKTLVALSACLLLAGCATINIYVTFPQEKIESAAEDFWMQLEKEPAPPVAPEQGAADRWFWEPAPLHAQTITSQPRLDSPVIEKAMETMRARLAEVRRYLAAGNLGENREGLLDIRSTDGLDREALAALRRVVQDDNRDRMIVYREIVRHNNMPDEELAKVQASFAAVNQRRTKPGEWIQNAEGVWSRKPPEGK